MDVNRAALPALTVKVPEGAAELKDGEKDEPCTVTTFPLASTPRVAPPDVGEVEFKLVNLSPELLDTPEATSRAAPGLVVPMPTFPVRYMDEALLLPASLVPVERYQGVLAGGV